MGCADEESKIMIMNLLPLRRVDRCIYHTYETSKVNLVLQIDGQACSRD